MAHTGPVERWEIYWVDLEPSIGSEQGGDRRPAVVVSNDGFNRHFEVVTVVPMTKRAGKKRRIYPFEVLAPDLVGTGHESILLPQQIRTISKRRLLERAGLMSHGAIQEDLENRILEHLGIDFEAEEP